MRIESSSSQWSKCIGVSRYGIRTDKPEAEWINGVNNWPSSNESIAGTPFNAKASTVADAVSRVFSPSYFQHWETFASTRYRKEDENSAYLSLEAIHNYIHVSLRIGSSLPPLGSI